MVAFELLGNESKETVFQLRLSRREAGRLDRLARVLHKSKAEAIQMAIVHTLGTLSEADKRMWTVVPGEPQVVPDEETA